MKRRRSIPLIFGVLLLILLPQNRFGESSATSLSQTAKPPEAQEKIAALKQSLQENQMRLRQYEWVETTKVNLKGETKSQKQERNYYGADGKIQKTPVGPPPPPKAAPEKGLKGRVIENKKEDMAEYMEKAVKLVHQYIPPNAEGIERSRKANKATLKPIEPGKRVRLELGDYVKTGDLLSVDLDAMNNQILGVTVSSYLDSQKDPIGLNVGFATLDDGTSYPAKITLDAKAKDIQVLIENSGYRKTGK